MSKLKRYEIDPNYPNGIVGGSYYDVDENRKLKRALWTARAIVAILGCIFENFLQKSPRWFPTEGLFL